MGDARYTICLRYDRGAGSQAFIVEDRSGDAYVCSGEGLCCRLSGRYRPERLTLTLLRLGWSRVADRATYTLPQLRGLLVPLAA